MKKGLLALTFITQTIYLFGSTCPTPILLTTQTQVNNFVVCDTILTTLTITSVGGGDEITDLTPLRGIRIVAAGGGISIVNTPLLTTLNGLETIDTTWLITITDNPMLIDINALSNLFIGNNLIVERNANLNHVVHSKIL